MAKKHKVKPTTKQKRAAENLVGNGGNVTQAMRDAGYSEATANTPQKLTESEGWEQLMNKYLPEKKLAEVHSELLGATVAYVNKDGEEVYTDMPDNKTRDSAVKLGYKVRGRLTDKVEHTLDKKVEDFLEQASVLLPKSK